MNAPVAPPETRDWNKDSVNAILDLAFKQTARQSSQIERLNSKANWFIGISGASLTLTKNPFIV